MNLEQKKVEVRGRLDAARQSTATHDQQCLILVPLGVLLALPEFVLSGASGTSGEPLVQMFWLVGMFLIIGGIFRCREVRRREELLETSLRDLEAIIN